MDNYYQRFHQTNWHRSLLSLIAGLITLFAVVAMFFGARDDSTRTNSRGTTTVEKTVTDRTSAPQ